MSYVWSTEGPAFVYPACYRTENRFLTLRAAALFLFALIVLWLALVEPDAPSSGAAVLRVKAERGHPAAHIIAGLVMLLLGVVDLVTAARQRRVLLQPGQPASLTSELSRQSAGISAGAPQLLRMLGSGQVPMPALRGNWLGALQRLSPRLPGAPSGLVDYLRLRVSHLLFAAGLLVVLGLAWPLAAGAPPLALAALLVAGLAAALAARSAWIASEAPSPRVVAVVLLVALLAAVALARLGGVLPHVGRLQPLALPVSALLVVLCLLVIEGLGLLAGRAQVPGAPQVDLAAADASADVRSDAERLMQEVERELHRFWSEGIPNRRHAWEPPAAKPGDTELGALVLEESQPLPLAADRDGSTGTTPQPWLLVLDTLGLLLTVGGGVLWVIQTYTQMQDGAAAWHYAAPGTVLLVAGGYALRVAHLLWGRVETDSLMIWLQIKGQAVLADLEQPLRLRACLVKLRSVFYIDAEHRHGSRTLLRLQGDAASAQRFVAQVQAYAERTSAAVAAPAARAAAPAPAAVPTARPAAPASGRVNARFCPACGTPVFQGARFCQHCGQTLAP